MYHCTVYFDRRFKNSRKQSWSKLRNNFSDTAITRSFQDITTVPLPSQPKCDLNFLPLLESNRSFPGFMIYTRNFYFWDLATDTGVSKFAQFRECFRGNLKSAWGRRREDVRVPVRIGAMLKRKFYLKKPGDGGTSCNLQASCKHGHRFSLSRRIFPFLSFPPPSNDSLHSPSFLAHPFQIAMGTYLKDIWKILPRASTYRIQTSNSWQSCSVKITFVKR